MSKDLHVEKILAAAGVDISAAKAKLVKLDEMFDGEAGDIPDGVLEQWVNEFFDHGRMRAFFVSLGKAWEAEHVATLPAARAWERGPDAAKEKAKRNLAKAKAK